MALRRLVTGIVLWGTLGIIPAVSHAEDLLKNADIAYGEYLAGEFSAADTLTGHACIVSARLGVDYSATPNVQAYVERLKARPALAKVLALRDA